jgi:pyrroline-5-carboxylate reductase
MPANITFIGGGNMATSLIGGLIAHQHPADCITVAELDANKLKLLQQTLNINIDSDNNRAIAGSDVVVLAVKPQIMQAVCRSIASSVQQLRPLIISIAAGIRSTDIDRWLGGQCAMVRCMPNTPALIQAGATGLFANDRASPAQRNLAENILTAAGMTLWVGQENLLDAVTAVSGSGPAYFFLFIEALQKAGEELGLDAETAQALTLQTALGAARMAIEGTDSAVSLRSKVTSKGGTTAAAIDYFQQHNFVELVGQALSKAQHRATELADILGKDQ